MHSEDPFKSFFSAFARPIYAHLWICWLCVAFIIIGLSDFRQAPVEAARPGRLVWIGGIGLLVELGSLLASLRYVEVREALFSPTRHRIGGTLPYLLKAVAILEGVAVVVVWL
jgi:hypothetical protein